MPKKKLKTVIGVLVDESGSMGIRRNETVRAFNDYFDEIEDVDPDATVVVAKFSDLGWANSRANKIRYLTRGTTVADMPYIDTENYIPNGSTPLYDAMGKLINKLSNMKADRYLFVILTDGAENASREFTKRSINKLKNEKIATDKWTFVPLTIGTDAINEFTSNLGFRRGQFFAPDATPALFNASMDTVYTKTRSYLASANTSDSNFFSDDKAESKAS